MLARSVSFHLKTRAEYKAGVLTVRLPLREEAKPKQIKVEVAA